jgi:hypothetical protein
VKPVDFPSSALKTVLGPLAAALVSPSEHVAAWHASLGDGVPFIQTLRGTLDLERPALRRVALDAGFGVASSIISIQRRMVVGSRDRRPAEQVRVERVARLPTVPPVAVDADAWSHLAVIHDPRAGPKKRVRSQEALTRLEEADPAGFGRLMNAAGAHDRAVDQLAARATATEDALVFAAAARALWTRFFGTELPLPALPAHAVTFVFGTVFSPLQVGALMASMDLLSTAPTADFGVEPARKALRHAVDRSRRFWRDQVPRKDQGLADELAREFVAVVGDLVLSEREAADQLVERAGELWRQRRPQPPRDGEDSSM